MKFIIAIIRPFMLDEVREALDSIGIAAMTVSDAGGSGRQRGHTEIYRGAQYHFDTASKAKIEIAVSDELADQAVEIIRETASTHTIGDGKIFVLGLAGATRIRTGETGEKAL